MLVSEKIIHRFSGVELLRHSPKLHAAGYRVADAVTMAIAFQSELGLHVRRMSSNVDYDTDCFTAFEVEKPSVLSIVNLTTRYVVHISG